MAFDGPLCRDASRQSGRLIDQDRSRRNDGREAVVRLGELVMILDLHRQGLSVAAIARETGKDAKTIRRYIAHGLEPPVYRPRPPQACRLDPYKAYLQERITAYPQLSGRRLQREVRDLGYDGGYTTITDFLRTVRPPATLPFEVRFETPPGRQAQVDFAQFQVIFADDLEVPRIVWLFSLVLGRFAWLCAIITTASLILSAARSIYDWSGKLRNSMEQIEAYSKLSARYLQLVEDIRYRRAWNDDFEKRFRQLREENVEIRSRPYSYPHWGQDRLRKIQN